MEARKLQISLQCAVVYGSSAAALSTYPSHYYIPSLRLCCTWPPTSEGFLCKACRFLTLCPAAAEVLCFSESTRLVILSTHHSPATPPVSVPSWGEEGVKNISGGPLPSLLMHPALPLSTRKNFPLPRWQGLLYHLTPCSSLISDVCYDEFWKL